MHGWIPKDLYFPSTIWGTDNDLWPREGGWYFGGPWFSTEFTEDPDPVPNFGTFREHRRRTFSDVCHSKPVGTPHHEKAISNAYYGAPWMREPRRYQHFIGYWNDVVTQYRDYNADPEEGKSPMEADGAFYCIYRNNGSQSLAIKVVVGTDNIRAPYSSISIHVYTGVFEAKRTSTTIWTRIASDFECWSSTSKPFGDGPEWVRTIGLQYLADGPAYGSAMRIASSVAEDIYQHEIKVMAQGKSESYSSWSRKYLTKRTSFYDGGITRWSEEPSTTFLLHEPEVILDGYDDIMFGRGQEAYFRNLLIERAYLTAVQSIPRMNDNNISNALEIASFIKSLVIDGKVKIPETLNDAWLAYRYSLKTTEYDVNDAIRFMQRNRKLGQWTYLKCYGTSHYRVDGVDIECRCTLEITPKEIGLLAKIWKSLYTFGLTPSFYVIWDMIPYSFIVDWLIPVGDILGSWDTEREFSSNYDIQSLIFSLKYIRQATSQQCYQYYTRWLASTPPQLHGYYFLEDDPSSATVVKRILDVIALTVHLPSS